MRSIHKPNPNIWIWPDWPEEFQRSRIPKRSRSSARTTGSAFCSTNTSSGRSIFSSPRPSSTPSDKDCAIGLYHDLALATDRCGSDLWAHPRFYVAGCRVGSPPDDFSPTGRTGPFRRRIHSRHTTATATGCLPSRFERTAKHGGALRIDHVMRFFRLFWIPEGKEATEGAYVRDYAEDLVRILALESVRNQVLVIGEDLGTVEPYIRETLRKFGSAQLPAAVFREERFELQNARRSIRARRSVSVSTHDLPTLAGFWEDKDIEARRKAGVLPDEASYHAQLSDRAVEKQKLLDLFHRSSCCRRGFPAEHHRNPRVHRRAAQRRRRLPGDHAE